MNRGVMIGVAAVALLLLVGCEKKADQGAVLGEKTGSVAGVTWKVPARWTVMPDRPMRVATYGIAAVEGDAEGAECAASFFGAGMGGDVDANIARWVGQFENASEPVRDSKEVHGITVATVKITGDYLSPSGPMMQSSGSKKGYEMLGAIINAPEGAVFFKVTGPSKTVESAAKEFDAMVNSLTK